jgi:hypothetical protein
MRKQNLSPETLAKRAAYNATPEQKHRRAMQNAARREMEAKGLVHKGDGKDVGHVKPLDAGGTNNPKNYQVQDAAFNRGWREGGLKQPVTKRER